MKNAVIRYPSIYRFLLLLLLCAWTASAEQPKVEVTRIKGKLPAGSAHIVSYRVDKASPDSGYETGSLHVRYSDNTEIVESLRPKEASTEQNVVFNQEGIEDVKVAPDKRAIAWAETYDNCCTSYSIPLTLAIYRSRATVLHISQGQMLWYWMFRDGGQQVAAVWGTTHGPEVGDYQLYETKTGRLVSEVFGDPTTQSLSADAPEWAKDLEHQRASR